MIRTILFWGAFLAVAALIITRPHETAGFLMTVIGGIVEFFKALANGFMNLFTGPQG